MSYPAPKGWKDFSVIKAITLTKTGEGNEIPCKIQNGQIVIDMPANTPVRITLRELSGQAGIDWKNVVFTGDLEYSATTSASGATSSLKLDVYRNSEKFGTKSPAILFVHGGGFAYGDKRQDLYVKMAVAFAARGYPAFSMNYTLKDEKEPHSQGILNRNVSQVLEAMKWIKSQASKFDIDTTRIFICGDSAGGGLAVNAGYSYDKGAGFAGCIDLWGGLPGKKIWDSPVYTGSLGKCVPPTCLIHGTSDDVVPYKSSQDLSDKLTAAGIYNELHPLENARHYPENLSDVFIPIMMAFTHKIATAKGKF
jgi:acetyl esterase/lipase